MNDDKLSPGMKLTLLAHAFIGLILGLAYLLTPDTVGSLMNWSTNDPIFRIIGAALVGFAASSWLAYQSDSWTKAKIVVQMEIIWLLLGGLASLWGLLLGNLPPSGWFNFGVFVAFIAAFSYFYTRA